MTRMSALIATFFGVGRAPFAPGTVASAIALAIGYPLVWWGGRFAVLVAGIAAFAIGAWATEHYARDIGNSDPSECVIDEVAGQWIALAFTPFTLVGFVLAFVLFRIFDIVKPWPISRLEKIPGGMGIMADDIAAGLVAGIVVAALYETGIL